MFETMGLEWPEAQLGSLCPGEWVEEVDPEDLPGDGFPSEPWWPDARDKGDELAPCLTGQEALDARLSSELARARRVRARESAKLRATQEVTQAFFRVKTQEDLEGAFVLLSLLGDRYHVGQGIITLAVKRVVRLGREARQARIDGLRELNAQMGDWARSIGYRVHMIEEWKPVANQEVRDQSWVLVSLRSGIAGVCRGKNASGKPILMCEPEIFEFMRVMTTD